MRLINPGPGEYCDRLSILALKIAHGRDRQKPIDHFQTEWATVLAKLAPTTFGGPLIEIYTKLVVVNARLWRAEDELRDWRERAEQHPLRETQIETVMWCAFGIQTLNDERSRLIEEINRTTGNHLGEEKL